MTRMPHKYFCSIYKNPYSELKIVYLSEIFPEQVHNNAPCNFERHFRVQLEL